MKAKKLLGALLVASTLILGACNGNSNTSKAGGSKTPATSSKAPTTSKERVPVPAVYYEEMDLVKKENDVYLQIKGSVEDIKETKLNFAFGLMTYQSSSGQAEPEEGGEGEGADPVPAAEEDPFIYGKETPADADYKFEVAIENNKFTAELKITGINFVGGEKYQVYTGSKGFYQALDEVTASETVLQDAEYKFYFRNDQEAGNAPKLVVDNLGPVRIEKVSIEKNVYDHTGIFAKIGGANKENLTQDQLDAFNSYVNFQKLPNTNTRVRKEGSQTEGNPYYFYKVEGNEVFIYINIDFMVAANATSGKYNTHLNIKENKQENCVSTVQIDGDPVTAREDGATIAVYSHPGVHNEDNIWGNVGFVVEIPEAEAGE